MSDSWRKYLEERKKRNQQEESGVNQDIAVTDSTENEEVSTNSWRKYLDDRMVKESGQTQVDKKITSTRKSSGEIERTAMDIALEMAINKKANWNADVVEKNSESKNFFAENKSKTEDDMYIGVDTSKNAGRLSEIDTELDSLKNRGIKIVIITNSTFNFDGAIVYHAKKKPSQIRLIVDSKLVLTGEITDRSNSTCLYSSNNNLVEVFKDSLTNEIKLIQIGKDDYENE